MHQLSPLPQAKPQAYTALARQAEALLEGEQDAIANAANLTALLYHSLPQVSWVGFYFLKGHELVVGPFQGKPACVRIALEKGVCGQAAARRETLVVADVSTFPGHIYCDPDARSEIVVPLVKEGNVLGVLDLDAPVKGRFDDEDRRGLEEIVAVWVQACR